MLINTTNMTNFTAALIVVNITTPATFDLIIAWFTVFSSVTSVLFNGVHLIVYFKCSCLRTAFHAYIVNLCLIEIVLASTAILTDCIHSFYGYWPFSASLCNLVVYFGQISSSANRYGHVLITCNRLWAVTFPVSYKERHTRRVAWFSIVATLIFLHALHLPVIISGRMWPAAEHTCYVNTSFQYTGALFVTFFGYLIPEVVVVLSYPYILFRIKKSRLSRSRIKPLCSTKVKQVSTTSKEMTTSHCATDVELVVQHRIVSSNTSSHDQILMFLVVSVIICWTPNHIYYLLVIMAGVGDSTYYALQYFLSYGHSWINPLLFYIALHEFRTAINKFLCG